ncbi:MAG TPA: LCP family protein [Firmicutes bacterium]|nr:LCP family protein [Bacillota bacterium]
MRTVEYDYKLGTALGLRRPRTSRRARRRVFSLIILTLCLLLAIGLAIGWTIFCRTVDISTAFAITDRPINIVILGNDVTYTEDGRPVEAATRADTILFLSMNPKTGSAHLISIPRDTRVRIPGHGTGKINSAHAIGGPSLIMETVEELLGLPVDRYVETDFRGFSKLIDMVGGVTVNVEKDMHYVDTWGKLSIDLKQGVQKLDGNKALQYVRFRNDALGDIGRVRRQQELAKAFAHQVLQPANIARAPQMIETAMKYVKTDMTSREILATGWFMGKVASGHIETNTLPGNFAPRYWMPDEEGIKELVASMVH